MERVIVDVIGLLVLVLVYSLIVGLVRLLQALHSAVTRKNDECNQTNSTS